MPRPTALLYGAVALFVLALHLITNATFGFHTDELYYLDCGRHPAFGYVDFPPIVPLSARLETSLLGVTPWTLRLLPSILSAALVCMCALYVRRLGGSPRLQALALTTGLAAAYFVGSGQVFQTVIFDAFAWAVALYWFLCIVITSGQLPPPPVGEGRGGGSRYWIYLGLTLGIALEIKYTILGLIGSIAIAILLTPSLRSQLRTPYPWLAAALALLIWLPNLVWQVLNGFPTLIYILHHQGDIATGGGPITYLIEFGLYLFLLIPLWIAGIISLFRSPLLRPVAIACSIPVVVFLFVGKSYYAASTIPVALAEGLMAISRMPSGRRHTLFNAGVVIASLLGFLLLSPLTLPITPPSRLHATGLDKVSEIYADSVGWQDIAHEVTSIYDGLPDSERSSTAIISAYYGVPGALHVYGGPASNPAIVSPQLSDWFWLPAHLDATKALMIDYQPSDVGWMCSSATLIAHLSVPYQVAGLEQGAPVTLCQLKAPISQYWNRLKNFS